MELATAAGWAGLAAAAARAAGGAAGEGPGEARFGAPAGAKAATGWVGAGARGGITWAACLASGISSPRE